MNMNKPKITKNKKLENNRTPEFINISDFKGHYEALVINMA